MPDTAGPAGVPASTPHRCWCDGSAYRPHPGGTDACRTPAPAAECTCVGGSWCVLHGSCTCPPYEDRELGPLTHVMGNIWVRPRLHAADCPLHGAAA